MSFDATGLISRVLERALEKFAQAQAGIGEQALRDSSPESMLIDTLASQLLGLVSGSSQLKQQNRRLARAVGACDCWGEISDCPECTGRGAPGWQLPQRENFEAVVRPALNRLASYRLSLSNAPRGI